MIHFSKDHFDTSSAAPALTPEDYVRLLHPVGAIGKTTLMSKEGAGKAHSKTYPLDTAPALVDNFLNGDGYITLHRFHGPRKGSRLAALNGLFLDLDVDRLPLGATKAVGPWAQDVMMRLLSLNLPEPSVLMSTGRGLAAIWLINPLPPQALQRWHAAQVALIDLFRSLGADPACHDSPRVTRLPGSLNSKSNTFASIISGSLARHDFDRFADEIYTAAGRPTRKELRLRSERKKSRKEGKHHGGLTTRARFRAILRDLECLRQSWGGLVPEGCRNTWLHLYGTCLSHTSEAPEVPDLIDTIAAEATPGLPRSEVAGVAKIASHHASLPRSCAPTTNGRYYYAGATIAQLLGVTTATARMLGLEQVMPKEERARRKAERESVRRRAAGAVARDVWLQENSREQQQPWTDLGISRSTYYRRLKAGQIVEPPKPATGTSVETGPCPQQGGSALPKAPVDGQSPATKAPTPTTSPSRHTRPARATQVEHIAIPAGIGLYEIVMESNPYVQSSHQQGEIDFARRRVYYPVDRLRRQ